MFFFHGACFLSFFLKRGVFSKVSLSVCSQGTPYVTMEDGDDDRSPGASPDVDAGMDEELLVARRR